MRAVTRLLKSVSVCLVTRRDATRLLSSTTYEHSQGDESADKGNVQDLD
jgi:hypothetical protein